MRGVGSVILVGLGIPLGCVPQSQPGARPDFGAVEPPSPPVPPAKIDSFSGPYRFLSNFWPAEVVFDGISYPTAEHAYQAAKTLDGEERRRIAALPTPSEAKKAGRQLALRPDWDSAKFVVMEACVRDKFTRHAELRKALLDTNDAYLEEGNTWGDRVWGVYQGEGENRLGKLLMKLRDELRAGHKYSSKLDE